MNCCWSRQPVLLDLNNLIYVPEEQQSRGYRHKVIYSRHLSTRGRQAQLLVIVGGYRQPVLLYFNNSIYVPKEQQSVSYRHNVVCSALRTVKGVRSSSLPINSSSSGISKYHSSTSTRKKSPLNPVP